MTEFIALRQKTYSYFMDDSNCDKEAMGTKKCVINRYLGLLNIKIAYSRKK